ncbi:uncharacterized protein LY89DRAFT_206348 [Mollisia scopiformis]|uniref:Uncharacterized protein n=1 Tax=Mollisia scopiformis TaxID=149040 RepID=A0A194WWL2_MOLSC|nr:uncharacterized protein LY89DRAFT_206348 [Mollisia scopiformis]KUJ12366.1 hypothetical protein LY89DRAFT_206348 [Mollisia scopiformis]
MAQAPLTFGVEFEIYVGHLKAGQRAPPGTNPRYTMAFTPSDAAVQELADEYVAKGTRPTPVESDDDSQNLVGQAARIHISEALSVAGFPAYCSDTIDPARSSTHWQVCTDATVDGRYAGNPDDVLDAPFTWAGVEIVSPVLPFTPESLEQVSQVCRFIRSNYRYKNNNDTALHVHVGDGNTVFPVEVVASLAAFFYAFEPQFNTLHPIHRIDSTFAEGMRTHSGIAERDFKKEATRSLPIIGVYELREPLTIQDITDGVSAPDNKRYMYVNWQNLARVAGGAVIGSVTNDEKPVKPTIEFRQHEGTLNPVRAIMWIRTVVGVVDAVRKLPAQESTDLVTICSREKWQKCGDGRDAEREARHGPIVAESTFTVVDLLRHLGLNEEANYYQDKMFQHDYPERCQPHGFVWLDGPDGAVRYQLDGTPVDGDQVAPFYTKWEYETTLTRGTEEYEAQHRLRLIWEEAVQSVDLLRWMDPDSPLIDLRSPHWPARTYQTVLPTPVGSPSSSNDSGASI